MKNIMRVFIRDLKNLNGNITAIIVIIGICIIPALYAWFNIAANWDPYGNTAGIKVAVANMDQGYDATELLPGRINIGDEIVSSLKDNEQIGWTFLDYDAAMEGVKRGDYYAAVIIPEDFSEKIASFLTDNIESPTIQYYVNEKKNAREFCYFLKFYISPLFFLGLLFFSCISRGLIRLSRFIVPGCLTPFLHKQQILILSIGRCK